MMRRRAAAAIGIVLTSACGVLTGIDDLVNVDAVGAAEGGTASDAAAADGDVAAIDAAPGTPDAQGDAAPVDPFCADKAASLFCSGFELPGALDGDKIRYSEGAPAIDDTDEHTGAASMRLTNQPDGRTLTVALASAGKPTITDALTLSFWWKRVDPTSTPIAVFKTAGHSIRYVIHGTTSLLEVRDGLGTTTGSNEKRESPPVGKWTRMELTIKKTADGPVPSLIVATVEVRQDTLLLLTLLNQKIDAVVEEVLVAVQGNPVSKVEVWFDDVTVEKK